VAASVRARNAPASLATPSAPMETTMARAMRMKKGTVNMMTYRGLTLGFHHQRAKAMARGTAQWQRVIKVSRRRRSTLRAKGRATTAAAASRDERTTKRR